MIDPEKVATRLFEAFGGAKAYLEHVEARRARFDSIWDQDAEQIGRVLRAHLAVEFFLTEFIQFANPNLGPLLEARLTFTQKVELLDDRNQVISWMKPGLRRLNVIRNRIAHKLKVEIDETDRAAFLNIGLFAAFRNRMHKEGIIDELPSDPVSVLEEFADFAAGQLHHCCDPKAHAWRDAMSPDGPSQMTDSGKTIDTGSM